MPAGSLTVSRLSRRTSEEGDVGVAYSIVAPLASSWPSVTINGMLLPKFTIRSLLAVMTGSSLLCLVAMFAVRGQYWAIAITVPVLALALTFLIYGLVFAGAFLLASTLRLLRPSPSRTSPFATQAPPPQLVPPEEPE